jgi:hypothetical protein
VKQHIIGLIAACALALGTAACSTSTDSTSTSAASTAPTAAVTTENFSGTVQVGGSDSNPFTVVLSGGVLNLTLTSAGPPATIFMGFGAGTYVGTTCQLLTGGFLVTPAGTTPQISGTINGGQYCVMVYDAGNQVAPITYSVTVTHY